MYQAPPPDIAGSTGARLALPCTGDACVTCSDCAVVVRVAALLDGDLAEVDTEAGREEISVALVDAGPGDWVLVQAKEAVATVEKPS